jgi:hypothetical protein
MGFMAKNIHSDPQTGRLSFRKVFPAHLRPFVPKGIREVKVSLKSKSLDPQALRILADAQATYARLLDAAQRKAAGDFRQLDAIGIDFLVQTHSHRLRESLIQTHYDRDDSKRDWLTASAWRYVPLGLMDATGAELAGRDRAWSNSQRLREALPALLKHWRVLMADADSDGIIEAEGQTALDLCLEFNLRAKEGSPIFFQLCEALLRADMLVGVQLARSVDPEDATPLEPVSPPAPLDQPRQVTAQQEKAKAPEVKESLPDLGKRLVASPRAKISRTCAQGWQTALRYWNDVHPSLDWRSVSRAKVSEWLDMMVLCPLPTHKRDKPLPLAKLVAKYDGDEKVKRITGRTVEKHCRSMAAIWNRAMRNGWIDERANPFSSHDIEAQNSKGGNPCTPEELAAIFRLPVFTKGERPIRGRGEAAFWLPLLSLHTGARPAEVAQLILADFWQEDGVWIMRYTDEGDHPLTGPRRLKTSEHGTGRRKFPVPLALLDLGLTDYIAWLKAQREEALFPQLTATTKGLYRPFGDWWSLYTKEHRVIASDKRPLREFRHMFATRGRASGVTEDALNYILGHSIAGAPTTASYGDRSPLGREITKITDFGVDLGHIPRWTPPRRN